MPIYKIKLLERKEITKDTVEFIFEKPEGFDFVAGQYCGFTLIDPKEKDDRGITRSFSLLNSPDDEYIKIATRIISSAYKRVLKELPLGSAVKFAGPAGKFVLHKESHIPAVFIAGGIGVTPFYSMIQHTIQHPSAQQIYLFYGNPHPDNAPYLVDLKQLENKNPQFKLIATVDHADTSWQGEKGFIDEQMLKKYLPDINTPIYYICGSEIMVSALHATLINMGIKEEQIRLEEFPGY